MAEISGGGFSVPTTPIPTISSNHQFFESHNTQDDEHFWDAGQVVSPGSKRCPTFKDYADKIKQLKQENFQLRVRVFLGEQKTGIKTSSSDFAVLFQENMQQLQNAFNANNNASNNQHSMTQSSSSSNDNLSSQLNSLKSQNEELNTKVDDLEQKLHNYESALRDKQRENEMLAERNESLMNRLEEMETEFTLTKVKLQQQVNQTQCQISTNNDYDVERGARIAFGQYDDDVDQSKREVEVKLQEESFKVQDLEKKLSKMNRDLQKSLNTIEILKKDKKESDTKIVECSKALVEFGKRNMMMSSEIEGLKISQQKELNNSKAADSAVQSRYNSIRELVGLLQCRISDITAFIEALLDLEAKKVFTLHGLKNESRDNLHIAVNQCKKLSESLDELFEISDNTELTNRRLKLAGLSLSHNISHYNDATYNSHNNYSFEGKNAAGDRIPGKKCVSSLGIQCELLHKSREITSPVDKTIVSKLKRDLEKSEATREGLILEQSKLKSKIATLQTNLKLAQDKVENLEKATRIISNQTIGALEEENSTLNERLTITDSALQKLHVEHAKLVAELKYLRTLRLNASQEKLSLSYLESERPSDTTSPDLGIDSGHDGAANSDDSNGNNNYKTENRALRSANKELAQKLRQTRQALDKTLEKLHSTTKQKEQVEKAICRQLHKTHTILRQAKKSVEKFTSNQCQVNAVPCADLCNQD